MAGPDWRLMAWHLRTEHGWSWKRLQDAFANQNGPGTYPLRADVKNEVEYLIEGLGNG